MKKISFRNVLTQCGVGIVVIFFASIGSILIREAWSFKDPGGGPGASGALAPDVGVIGNPADGITGAPTLFQGQAAIKTAVDGIGGGGKVFQSVFTTNLYTGNLGGLAEADAKCQAEFGPDFHFARSYPEWIGSAPDVSYLSAYIWIHNDTLNCNSWTNGTNTPLNNALEIFYGNGRWDLQTVAFCGGLHYLACTNR